MILAFNVTLNYISVVAWWSNVFLWRKHMEKTCCKLLTNFITYIQYMYNMYMFIVGKFLIIIYASCRNGPVLQWVQIYFIFIHNVCTLYIVFIAQCQKLQNNWHIVLKRAEIRFVLIVFKGVLCHVGSYTVPSFGWDVNKTEVPCWCHPLRTLKNPVLQLMMSGP